MAYDPSGSLATRALSFLENQQQLLLLQAPYTLSPTGDSAIAPESPVVPAVASATNTVVAILNPSNNSGVSGQAVVHLDREGGIVTLDVVASGLAPSEIHPQHIHGFADDRPSLLPNITLDADRDGFVEDPEGAVVVAPALLSGTASGAVTAIEISADFPAADASGNLDFRQEYKFDLTDTNQLEIFQNLEQRLAGREFQIHGLNVAEGEGAATGFEVDGTAGYKIALPVANGVFLPVVDQATVDVARLYVGLLNRAPDTEGLQNWSALAQSGGQIKTIAEGFLNSLEYSNHYPTPLSSTQYIEALYQNSLGRAPEAGGDKYWSELLDGGASRADVALGIAGSLEAQNLLPIGLAGGWDVI